MKKLADILGVKICDDYISGVKTSATGGDGGIDLFAFYPIDKQKGMPFALCQCACSYSDWENKQHSIGQSKMKEILYGLPPYLQMTFVPCNLHDIELHWDEPYKILTCVIDRYRLIEIIQQTGIQNYFSDCEKLKVPFDAIKAQYYT